MNKQSENRKKVLKIYIENPSWSHKNISKQAGVAKSTVTGILNRYKRTHTIDRKTGSGKKQGFVDKKKAKSILLSVENNPTQSLRDLAKKFKCSHSYVRKVLKSKGIKACHKIKIPKRSIDGEIKAIRRAKKLNVLLNRQKYCIIEDDEKYCKKDSKQLPGQQYFYQMKGRNVLRKFKYLQTEKFAPKFLVWQAICSCGLKSSPFITSKILNADLYIKECLQKRLLPMIEKHNVPVMFWPDLASIHYSKKTLKWFHDNAVEFVPKDSNPPNCPEQRVIESYWSIVKGILRKGGKLATDNEDFKKKWIQASKKVPEDMVRSMMAGTHKKIRVLARRSIKDAKKNLY